MYLNHELITQIHEYNHDQLVNGETPYGHSVYLLTFPCGSTYVGYTSRTILERFREHIGMKWERGGPTLAIEYEWKEHTSVKIDVLESNIESREIGLSRERSYIRTHGSDLNGAGKSIAGCILGREQKYQERFEEVSIIANDMLKSFPGLANADKEIYDHYIGWCLFLHARSGFIPNPVMLSVYLAGRRDIGDTLENLRHAYNAIMSINPNDHEGTRYTDNAIENILYKTDDEITEMNRNIKRRQPHVDAAAVIRQFGREEIVSRMKF